MLKELEEKYSQSNELQAFALEAAKGLDVYEQELIRGPMRRRGSVLDVGCGAGREAIGLSRLGYAVKGIDISAAMVEQAKSICAKAGLHIEFERQSVLGLGDKDKFDYVYFPEAVYHHIPTKSLRIEALRRAVRAVKPKGSVFLVISTRGSHKQSLKSCCIETCRIFIKFFLGKYMRTERGDALIKEVSDFSNTKYRAYYHFFSSRQEIEQELSSAGFKVSRVGNGLWQVHKSLSEEELLYNAGRNLLFLVEAKKISLLLQQEKIEVLYLKGLPLALTVYPDSGMRPMADIDILIRKSDRQKVKGILAEAGYEDITSAYRKKIDMDAVFSSRSKICLDLHWEVFQFERFKGLILLTQDFWKRQIDFPIDGVSARTLCPEDQVLCTALHWGLFDFLQGNKGAMDIYYLNQRYSLDWEAVVKSAKSANLRIPLYYCLRQACGMYLFELEDYVWQALKPPMLKKTALDYLLRHRNIFSYYLGQCLMMPDLKGALLVGCRIIKTALRMEAEKICFSSAPGCRVSWRLSGRN